MTTLAEWNNDQIQEALSENSRVDYYDATGNLFPTVSQLIIFWIENNAAEFQQAHEDD